MNFLNFEKFKFSRDAFFSPRTIRDGDDDIEMINKYKILLIKNMKLYFYSFWLLNHYMK